MNQIKIIAAIFIATLGLQALPAYAHGTEKDNDISVIYHIDPNDKAVAGKPSTVYFFVTDKDNQYDDSKCDCRVTIMLGDKTVLNKVIHEKDYLGDPTSIATKFIFPKLGTYHVSIDAKPQKEGQFQPFRLSYVTNITTGTSVSSISMHTIIGVGTGFILILGLSYGLLRKRKASLAQVEQTN
jgi:hypothetical protein